MDFKPNRSISDSAGIKDVTRKINIKQVSEIT
jgi:hypothetical protein